MSWVMRAVDRVTTCRWKGHVPWIGFCERCGKTLDERATERLPPRGL